MNDLISRAALLQEFETKHHYHNKAFIENAPAVDAKPVVHGKWLHFGKTTTYHETLIHEKCSVCGRKVTRTSMQPQVNFCPECGADMRKEGE